MNSFINFYFHYTSSILSSYKKKFEKILSHREWTICDFILFLDLSTFFTRWLVRTIFVKCGVGNKMFLDILQNSTLFGIEDLSQGASIGTQWIWSSPDGTIAYIFPFQTCMCDCLPCTKLGAQPQWLLNFKTKWDPIS